MWRASGMPVRCWRSVERRRIVEDVSRTGRTQPGNAHDDVPPGTCGKEPEDSDRTGIIRYVHAPDPCSKYRPPGLSDADAGLLDSVCTRALQFEDSHLTHCYASDASGRLRKTRSPVENLSLFASYHYDSI